MVVAAADGREDRIAGVIAGILVLGQRAEIDRRGERLRLQLGGSVLIPVIANDSDVETAPTIVFEETSGAAFVLWQTKVGNAFPILNLASRTAEGWSQAIELSGNPYAFKSTPQLLVTRDTSRSADRKLEHHWADLLENAPQFRIPIPKFGSSDYHRSRASHLIAQRRSDIPADSHFEARCLEHLSSERRRRRLPLRPGDRDDPAPQHPGRQLDLGDDRPAGPTGSREIRTFLGNA